MPINWFLAVKGGVSFSAKKLISEYQKRKRLEIIDNILKRNLSVTSDMAQSDEFIAAYLALENALFMSASKQKLDLLIDLFVVSCNTGKIKTESDRFAEILSIINELSDREIVILYHLFCYEVDFLQPEQENPKPNHQVNYLQEKTGLERELIIAILIRLRRTGLLITIGERADKYDLMLTGIETMCISPIAQEIKDWVYDSIHGFVAIR